MGEIVLVVNNKTIVDDAFQINVERLSEGVYFLKIEGENTESSYQKFIKLR